MAEWTCIRDFSTRVANLNGTGYGGLNGSYFLAIEHEIEEPTVFDDNARDVLTGSSGIDWFIFNSTQDKATDLSDEEFADALDFILTEV